MQAYVLSTVCSWLACIMHIGEHDAAVLGCHAHGQVGWNLCMNPTLHVIGCSRRHARMTAEHHVCTPVPCAAFLKFVSPVVTDCQQPAHVPGGCEGILDSSAGKRPPAAAQRRHHSGRPNQGAGLGLTWCKLGLLACMLLLNVSAVTFLLAGQHTCCVDFMRVPRS